MNPRVFREYDIRGVADRDFGDDFVRDLGRALGTFLRRRLRIEGRPLRIALGRDCRLSGPRLHDAIRAGLLETGVHLVDIGVGPTPAMYFSVFHLDLDGGVQVTGSHNPPAENGFKMMCGKGTVFGADVQELRRIIEERDFETATGGSSEEIDLLPAYVGFMKGNFELARTDVKVVVDAGNGAAGPLCLAAMRGLGLEPDPLYCEMDGNFPNHHPDPTLPENIADLIARVRSTGAELGIAFDGDGDRLGAVDAEGNVLWGDALMILFSRQILRTHPGGGIIAEVKCSQTLFDDIAKSGGRPILWKTGHSLIKAKLKEEKALLAGEMSGHLFFADRYWGFDDAIYAALRLVELVAASDRSVRELLADVPKTFVTPELRVDCPDELKFQVVERVRDRFRKTHDVIDVDGARILFGDAAWGLVRASNTQPILVLRFEARTQERLDEIRAEVERAVEDARAS